MATLRVYVRPKFNEAATVLSKNNNLRPFHLKETANELYWEITDTGFFADDIFLMISGKLPEMPKEFVLDVTIVDHILDGRKFIIEGRYEIGEVTAGVTCENGKHGIVQKICILSPTVKGAVNALITLRQGELEPKIWLEPKLKK
jgi:hypothetical protein